MAALDIAPTTEAIFSTTMDDLVATTVTAPLQDLLTADETHHNQITFQIPTAHDLEHIDRLQHFNTLLKRIGNVAYDTIADHHINHFNAHAAAAGVTHEQIRKSAVLDLADIKDHTENSLERFFAGTDMHSIINYLWIGVVTSLVVLSVIFILFSCYFYRKFRVWKKCNKDIRAHLNGDMYPGGTVMPCDSLLLPPHGQQPGMADGMAAAAAAYYQMESPPCYTIATGLPTYDEALHHHHHHQHQQQQQHYAFGMKFMYPAIAAVHHHQHSCTTASAGGEAAAAERQQQQQQQQRQQQHRHIAIKGLYAGMSHWEKQDYVLQQKQQQLQQQQQQQQEPQQGEQPQQYAEKCFAPMRAAEEEGAAAPTTPPSYHEAAASLLLLTEMTSGVTKVLPQDGNGNGSGAANGSGSADADDDTAMGGSCPGIPLRMPAASSEKPDEVVIAMDEVLTATEPAATATTTTTTSASTAAAMQSTDDCNKDSVVVVVA